MKINKLIFLVTLFFISNSFSQDLEILFDDLDPLDPSKAAFFSAVFPGAGQAFNKKYWSYRNAYKSRKAGYSSDEFQNLIIDDDRLLDGASFHKKNRDLSMVFIVGFYILNVLDANIDAHLKQYNVNENLTLNPYFDNGSKLGPESVGLSLNLNF